MTLVELAVSIGLLSVVLAMLLTVLVSVQNSLGRQTSRSGSNDQARLAVEELDREVRSGNVLYDPSLENDATHFIFPGMALRIFTQANAPTREAGGISGERCVQWRIKYNKAQEQYELQRREWVQDAVTSTPWQVVATDVMNRVSPPTAAFSVDPAKRIVNISILVNRNTQNGTAARVDTTVEGRNTVYGYGNNVCSSIPAYPTPDPSEA
jgi:type II secretory pathway pseudopilin PulG